jgi:transcriptional regulator with XRE-family HTH domain
MFVNKCACLNVNSLAYILTDMKYGERLRAARKYALLTQKELEDRINRACSQSNISQLEQSDADGSEYTAQFADACGVRALWLATGQGDMVDTYQIKDERIRHLAMVAEALPDYAVDQVVRDVDSIAELIRKATETGKKAG